MARVKQPGESTLSDRIYGARRGLSPEHVYWCSTCGSEGPERLCPGSSRPHANRVREDVGWRVGNHKGDYSYYASQESAMKDRRVK